MIILFWAGVILGSILSLFLGLIIWYTVYYVFIFFISDLGADVEVIDVFSQRDHIVNKYALIILSFSTMIYLVFVGYKVLPRNASGVREIVNNIRIDRGSVAEGLLLLACDHPCDAEAATGDLVEKVDLVRKKFPAIYVHLYFSWELFLLFVTKLLRRLSKSVFGSLWSKWFT